MLDRLRRRAWRWYAYWRLYPLWAVLRRAIPEIVLPPDPAMRRSIRYRLYRRVIEIRDAQLALRPYAEPERIARAVAAARSSGLAEDAVTAVAEAAAVVTSVRSRFRGCPGRAEALPAEHPGAAPCSEPGTDVGAEAARLITVSRAIRRSRIVRQTAGRPPRFAPLPRMTRRGAHGMGGPAGHVSRLPGRSR
jgi:hypothetical protein